MQSILSKISPLAKSAFALSGLVLAVFAVSAQILAPAEQASPDTPTDSSAQPDKATPSVIQSGMSVSDIVTTSCATCHGADGQSISPMYPSIAGQHADYLEKQLVDFKQANGSKRPNPVMQVTIAPLELKDFQALALYFSALSPRKSSAKNTETLEMGRQFWRAGNAKIQIASCTGCHGPNGLGIPTAFPRLAGQHRDYTALQLVAFAEQTRTNDPNGMMQRVAERMTGKEIQAVANFIEGLR